MREKTESNPENDLIKPGKGGGGKSGPGSDLKIMLGNEKERRNVDLDWKGEQEKETNFNGPRTQPRTI